MITLVLADDHAVIRAGIRAILSKAPDLEIIGEAENGDEVQELVAKLRPRILLLDLKMPKVDGLEVLRVIKGDPQLKLIPVVVMTSSREEGDMLRSYELGVNAYVVKPMKFHELVDAVKQVGSFWAVINEPPPGSLQRAD